MAKINLTIDFSEDRQTVSCDLSSIIGGVSYFEAKFELPTTVKDGDDLWDRIGEEVEKSIRTSPFRSYFGN